MFIMLCLQALLITVTCWRVTMTQNNTQLPVCLAGPLSQCAVDIVFTRSKPPGSRRLSFKEFLEAVTTVAEEAGCGFGQVIAALSSITSPVGEGPPSSQRPGSAPTVTSFNISDLTDHRVGPVLPTHSAAPNSEGPSQRSAWSGSYNGVRHIVPTPPVGGECCPTTALKHYLQTGV